MMISLNDCKAMRELLALDEDIISGGFVELGRIRTEEEYLKKAIGFNFWERAFRMGALLGGMEKKVVDMIGEVGKNIGIAYIIANDTWDFGKDLSDFMSGKITLPILWALKNASISNKAIIKKFLGKELTSAQKNQIRRIMVESGAIAYGKKKADEYCAKAEKLLRNFKSEKIKELIRFSMTMTQRNRYYSVLDKF